MANWAAETSFLAMATLAATKARRVHCRLIQPLPIARAFPSLPRCSLLVLPVRSLGRGSQRNWRMHCAEYNLALKLFVKACLD